MLSEDGEHAVHDGQSDRRKAVKGFAEFYCSPVANKDEEPSEGHKVSNTKLQYTYPVRNVNKTIFLHTLSIMITLIFNRITNYNIII